MAEVAVSLVGAGAALSAAKYATSSGFAGRHETAHRAELADLERSASRFSTASDNNGQAAECVAEEFKTLWEEARQKNKEYYQILNDYKDTSWVNPLSKARRRKAVRSSKRAARDVNHSLRDYVDDVSSHSSHSDTSSVYAASGSPPGSALEREGIDEWRHQLLAEDQVPDDLHLWQSSEPSLSGLQFQLELVDDNVLNISKHILRVASSPSISDQSQSPTQQTDRRNVSPLTPPPSSTKAVHTISPPILSSNGSKPNSLIPTVPCIQTPALPLTPPPSASPSTHRVLRPTDAPWRRDKDGQRLCAVCGLPLTLHGTSKVDW